MKVITGGLLIDGNGLDPVPDASVVIDDDGRIVEAGSLDSFPAGAEVVDVAGKTIMPGMINAHGHVQKGHDASIPVREDLVRRLETYASYGVTTVVSLGAIPEGELVQISLRDVQDGVDLDMDGTMRSPALRSMRLDLSGPLSRKRLAFSSQAL